MKSTVVKPSNGRPASAKQKSSSRPRPWSFGLRRLTKRQKDRIYRIGVWVFLVVFTLTIVGTLVATTVRIPAK